MRHVKSEYEVCTRRYQHTMTQISAPSEYELQQQLHQRRQQQQLERERLSHHNHRQHQQRIDQQLNGTEYEATAVAAAAGPSAAELEEERVGRESIKLVCW